MRVFITVCILNTQILCMHQDFNTNAHVFYLAVVTMETKILSGSHWESVR